MRCMIAFIQKIAYGCINLLLEDRNKTDAKLKETFVVSLSNRHVFCTLLQAQDERKLKNV